MIYGETEEEEVAMVVVEGGGHEDFTRTCFILIIVFVVDSFGGQL